MSIATIVRGGLGGIPSFLLTQGFGGFSAGGGDTIVVTDPVAGARLLVGETIDIHVSITPGVSGLFDVGLSLDGGATFPITLLTDEAEIDLAWTITSAHITATAVLRVSDSADALIYGDSDEFIIATTTPGGATVDPPLSVVTIHIRDQFGVDLADIAVEVTFVRFTDDATVTPPVLSPVQLLTTDADGIVTPNLYRNAVYKVIYGSFPITRRVDFTVPDAGSYEVGE